MTKAVAVFAILAAVVAGAAHAGRIATPAEKTGIAASVREYVRTSGCCAAARIGLTLYRVSTVDRDFARVAVVMWAPSGERGPWATAVLVHTFSGRWAMLALGTARLACGLHPAIRRDLKLAACR